MLLLRLVGVLAVLGVALSVLLYLLSGHRSYLRWALRILKVALALVLFILVLMAGERFLGMAEVWEKPRSKLKVSANLLLLESPATRCKV